MEVWNHVHCLTKCKDGNCKEMKCKYCDEVFAGGAQRIIKHVKCHSCPSAVTDWGRRRQAAATARKGEKDDAKKLTRAFDGAADDATHQCIKGSIDKLGLATELYHEEVCNWVYVTLQSFNEPGQESFIKMLTTPIKIAPRHFCSILIGGEGKGGKASLLRSDRGGGELALAG
jgi:hypothetical protein